MTVRTLRNSLCIKYDYFNSIYADGELTVDDLYKKTQEEIEVLKDELGKID